MSIRVNFDLSIYVFFLDDEQIGLEENIYFSMERMDMYSSMDLAKRVLQKP